MVLVVGVAIVERNSHDFQCIVPRFPNYDFDSDLQRSPFYKEGGDFIFQILLWIECCQLGSTLYKVEADTFLTLSRPLKALIDQSVPNYAGSSNDNPFRLNSEIIEQEDFDALIEFYYK